MSKEEIVLGTCHECGEQFTSDTNHKAPTQMYAAGWRVSSVPGNHDHRIVYFCPNHAPEEVAA